MQPTFQNLRPRGEREILDKTVSLAYDRVLNGIAQLFNDTQRERMGTQDYEQYIAKAEGYSVKQTITGATGGCKGALMYIDPDPTGTDRARIIFAYNNKIYLYSIEDDNYVLIRDAEDQDSYTISYLSGVQMKHYAYFCVGDTGQSAALYRYAGTSTGSITALAAMTGSISAYAKPTGSITAYAEATATTTTITSAAHGLLDTESITITSTTNYDGTYAVSGVTTNTFIITCVFTSDEATGTWASNDKVTCTDAAHGMVDGDEITISTTTNYDGTYTIEDVATNTFVIDTAYVADDATGTWVATGKTTVTSASHGMSNGNEVTITGTTSYNDTYTLTNVATNTFVIAEAFVADDATGTWTGETLTEETQTALNASRLLGKMDNRLMAVGMGTNSSVVQYSFFESSGVFDDWTSSSTTDEGGTLSGSLGASNAFAFAKGMAIVFEEDQITVHFIETIDDAISGRLKDTKTIDDSRTMAGMGVESAKGVTVYNDKVFFATKDKGIYSYDATSKAPLVDLTKNFRPLIKDYDFSDAAIIADPIKNLLIVSCASTSDGAQDTLFVYNFDTKTWCFDNGKMVNQLFWDKINGKVFGMSAAENEIHELYDGGYTNNETAIEVSAETRMYDMGDRHRMKRFITMSVIVGAVNDSQSFKFEVFVNHDNNPVVSETKNIAEYLSVQGKGEASWGDTLFAGGQPAVGTLSYLTFFYDFFVPDFETISVRITESGSNNAVIHQPVIRFSETNDKIDSFI